MENYLLVVLRICAIFGLFGQASAFFCPPLQSQGIQCFDSYDAEVACTENQPIGTQVKCKEFYQSSTSEASCGPDGWSVPDFSCQIACGKSKEVNGQDRPFGATIYQIIKKDLNSKICAATLIGDGFVITIAHCMLDHMEKQLSNDVLLVGVGPVDNETIYQVKHVTFSTKFNETKVVDPDDLGILTLRDFKLSRDVLPACLPICGQMDAVALRDGSTGEIFPRGKGKPEKLKVKVTANCTHFNDFCAGSSGDTRGKKCPEEFGTGITVSIGEEAHFIYGILSSTAQPSCKNYRTFKRIFPYFNWIKTVAMIEMPPSELLDLPITTTPSRPESTTPPKVEGSTPSSTEGTTSSGSEIQFLIDATQTSQNVEGSTPSSTEGTTWSGANIQSLIDATQTSTPESLVSTTEPLHPTMIYASPADHFFVEISKEEQMGLVNLTIRETTIKNEVLINSLKFAKNLVRLDIQNATLDSGFNAVEDLPLLTTYIFSDVHVENRPNSFQEYFPFYKARTLYLSEFPKKFDEVNIDDGLRRFLLKPSQGTIVISNFPNLQVDDILTALPTNEEPQNFEWKRITLEKVKFNYDSIPSSLVLLRLSSINITLGQMSKLLARVPNLEILGVHDLEDRKLQLEALPVKSLQRLRLDRANLTYTPPSLFSFFSKLPKFESLVQFYWGLDVFLDEEILTNFANVFPNVKEAAYFGRNNFTIVETLLDLPKLELLYIRIHEARSPKTLEILERINFDFDNSTVGPNLDMIHVCVERKPGGEVFSSRYLGSSKELLEVDGKFDEGVDIAQCQGFSSY